MRRMVTAAVFFGLLLAAWQWATIRAVWSPLLFPSPAAVGRYLGEMVREGTLASATFVTLRRLLVGYAVGILLGVPIGLLTSRFRVVHDTLGTVALGLQALPSVCWVPPALLWFGQSESAMLFVVVMGSIWSVVLAAESGVRNVNPLFVRAARTMGSRWLHIWTHVIIPASLPLIVSGMKQGWAFAWRSLMAAEIFVTILTGSGLGQLLQTGREQNAMDQMVGIMFVLVLLGLLADKLLFSPWESWMHRRWGTDRAA